MGQIEMSLVEIDGAPASSADLIYPALVNYGHFTAMQVRAGAARGVDRHLSRLHSAHGELFGTDIDVALVRKHMRHAVERTPDAYLRVTLYESERGIPRVMTVVRPPVELGGQAYSLAPVAYLRPFAHLKHVGTFAQIRHGQAAEDAGHDDALLVGPDGRIAETTMGNIGFVQGERVIWPDAPALQGITRQLLDEALVTAGVQHSLQSVTLEAARTFDGAFVTNSVGVAGVRAIGDIHYTAPVDGVARLIALYAALPWEPL